MYGPSGMWVELPLPPAQRGLAVDHHCGRTGAQIDLTGLRSCRPSDPFCNLHICTGQTILIPSCGGWVMRNVKTKDKIWFKIAFWPRHAREPVRYTLCLPQVHLSLDQRCAPRRGRVRGSPAFSPPLFPRFLWLSFPIDVSSVWFYKTAGA